MKLLAVKWDEWSGTRYYVDKDRHSRAHERKGEYILDTYSGTYHFNIANKKVTLDTGVEIRPVNVLEWHIDEEEE